MENIESKNYREKLARELRETPKDMRKAVLKEARESDEYISYFLEHNRPRIDKREAKRDQRIKEQEPDLEFNLDEIEDLKEKLNKLAKYIYSTISAYDRSAYDREGGYDPQKGHMLCGEITDRFIAYLKSRGIDSRRISRTYEIKDPNGEYNDNFGHTYLIIDRQEDHTLVDPTYMQWLSVEQRQGRPSVLVIRFKDEEDFRSQFKEIPVENDIALPFYLGFDSEEAKQFFKDSEYVVISDERARIDN